MINTFSKLLQEHFVPILILVAFIFLFVGMHASWKERIECQTKMAEKKVAVQDIKKICN